MPIRILMITLSIVAFGVLLLLAAGTTLFRAVNRAPEGYEDELGFHEGVAPRLVEVMEPAVLVRSNDSADPGWMSAPSPAYHPTHKTPVGAC